jgi:L-fuconolactonase
MIARNREAGIDKTVLVQGFGPYVYDNNYAADCGVQHANHFACICIVDQLQKDAPDKLTYWVKERGVRGLRFITIAEQEVMIDDPRGLPLWERAVSLAIPVCIMGRFHQVPRMPPLLERFSSIPVALDHIAVPRLSDGPPYDSLKPLFDLVRFSNLYLKFSSETIRAARKGKSICKEFFSRCSTASAQSESCGDPISRPRTVVASRSNWRWLARSYRSCRARINVGSSARRRSRCGRC